VANGNGREVQQGIKVKIPVLEEQLRHVLTLKPLAADAVTALEATRGQHPRWCFTFAGERIHQSSTAWDKAKQRAGIEDFRFHDLRHTVAPHVRNVAKSATFSLRSVHWSARKFLINWRARRDSNSRPPGS
jgi:integrase